MSWDCKSNPICRVPEQLSFLNTLHNSAIAVYAVLCAEALLRSNAECASGRSTTASRGEALMRGDESAGKDQSVSSRRMSESKRSELLAWRSRTLRISAISSVLKLKQ
jgi:hypothetical protein